MIEVLLVDDNAEVRTGLRRLLAAHSDIAVVGEASSGKEAVRLVTMLKPDVVLMDADMPGMDGFETTCEIMDRSAVPIIIVSTSQDTEETDKAFKAMEAGAVALVAMPSGAGEADRRRATEIVQTVRAMSEVRVVHRRRRRGQASLVQTAGPKGSRPSAPATQGAVDLVVIGASTGGPQALQTILARLPKDLEAAVSVVQHITPDFQKSFVGWLGQATGLPVHLAVDGQALARGHVYVAPHPYQMGIDRHRKVKLRDDPPENGLRPAVSYLFRSAAAIAPRRTAAVLLTGMGQDGAAELLELRSKGAITIAQDVRTSIVHGMPGEAIRLGGAMYILSPEETGDLLAQLTRPAAENAGSGNGGS